MRGGRGNLAVTGSFFLLLSSFLALSRTLSPLPRSHPSLFPQLGLSVGSDVTSAEIPPNSTAQWRAGGQPSPAARRAFKERAKRSGERGGSGQGRREARQGREARPAGRRAGSREPEEEPRERRRGREPGRALRQEQMSGRRKQSYCGKEDRRGGWDGREEKGNLRRTRSANKSEGEDQGVRETETYSWGANQDGKGGRDRESGPRNGTKDRVHGFVWGESCGVYKSACLSPSCRPAGLREEVTEKGDCGVGVVVK